MARRHGGKVGPVGGGGEVRGVANGTVVLQVEAFGTRVGERGGLKRVGRVPQVRKVGKFYLNTHKKKRIR